MNGKEISPKTKGEFKLRGTPANKGAGLCVSNEDKRLMGKTINGEREESCMVYIVCRIS